MYSIYHLCKQKLKGRRFRFTLPHEAQLRVTILKGVSIMKKTLNAILCVMLVALMGVAAPLLILFSAKQTDTPAVSDGFDAVYADEEEDDLSGLAADALYTVNADIAGNGYARATSLAYS